MKKYFEPTMKITSFDKEEVATTPSSALAEWQQQGSTDTKYKASVDFSEMGSVDVTF